MRRCGLGINVDVDMGVSVGVGVVYSTVLSRPKTSNRRVSITKPSYDRMAYNDKSYRLSY